MRVWCIRGGERNRLVRTFEDESVVAVGYASVPDARTLADGELEHVLARRGGAAVARHARMFRNFVDEMAIGDVVLLPDTPSRELLVGRVAGPYEFQRELPAEQYRHRRAVDWIDRIPFEALPPAARTLYRQQQTLLEKQDAILLDLL